jgi:hypothetical protein
MSDAKSTNVEKRLSSRAKISRMLRVRPSGPDDEHFEELLVSTNMSKHGIYFHTHRSDYYQNMRLFITFPFTFEQDPTKREYLAEVVRVEKLTDDRIGVAVRLIVTV